MTATPSFLVRLTLERDADERAVRRAYARELKLIDQETEAEQFQQLREAYEYALDWVRYDRSSQDEYAFEQDDGEDGEKDDAVDVAPDVAHDVVNHVQHDADIAKVAPPICNDHSLQDSIQPSTVQTIAPILPEQATPLALAQQAFDEFMLASQALCKQYPKLDARHLERNLRAKLDDPRLINMSARDEFEALLVRWIADGWQPGNEILFVAATTVFQWNKDQRGLRRFGHLGYIINRALDEREMFFQTSEAQRDVQREIIYQLRKPQRPSNYALLRNVSSLDILHIRYPNWLRLITDLNNLPHWKNWEKEIPAWQRLVVGKRRASKLQKEAEPQNKRSAWRYGWWVLWAIYLISRFVSS